MERNLYHMLETDYEALTSDETVAETLIASEYMFTIDGKID